ncbi:O-antigen ligase domain-containing protein [Flavobacteriaceae bacterium 144Ye]|nr:O-antigen ligase domain-containing protein [Flavobacteriaceae bacterium 144Ye]
MSINIIISKSSNILCVLFVLFTVFPVKLNYSSMVIIALSIIGLVNLFVSKNKKNAKLTPLIFLISIPFMIYMLGLVNTTNLRYGTGFLLKNLSFVAFPFVFYSLNNYINRETLFKTYLIGLTIVNSYLIYLFIYYYNFGAKFYMIVTTDIYHSTFLGMYNIVAFWICISIFMKKNKKLYSFLATFFLLSAIISSARIIFVLSIVSIGLSILFIIKSRLKRILAFSMICIVGILVLFKVPSIKQKFNQFKEIKKIGFDKHNYQSISSRFGKIEATTTVLKENFWFGTGTGDLLDELVKEYKNMNFLMGYKYRYNPHNQYLDNLTRNGIIGGGISLIVIFLLPLYFAIRNKNKLLFTFIITVGFVCLTESVLDVHKGITFYTFFITLIISNYSTIIKNLTFSIPNAKI